MTEAFPADSPARPVQSADRPGGQASTLLARVEAQLDSLLALGGQEAAGASLRGVLQELAARALDQPAEGPFEGLSFINADGTPFQWVLRIGRGGADWGFLCESGQPFMPPRERLALTLSALAEASRTIGGAPPPLGRIAGILCPAPDEPWPAHWRSGAWSGVAVGGGAVRLKPYFNLNRGEARERWLRFGRLLQAFGRDEALAELCRLSGACSPGFWPVGAAVDLTPDGGVGRLKAYFRAEAGGPARLAPWYAACGLPQGAEAMRTALDLLGQTGSDRYPADAFVLSLEVHADQRLSLKTDLAVTRWLASDREVFDATEALAQRLGLAEGALATTLETLGVEEPDAETCVVARFVGVGCEPDGELHLNVYLAPPPGRARPARAARAPRAPRRALEIGVRALLDARSGPAWADFRLPVGASDRWVSAYVLASLAMAEPAVRGDVAAARKLREALDWLAAAQTPGGGWGYNSETPADADSTAWALLALAAWGRRPPPAAVAFLQRCLGEAGAATYPDTGAPRPFWSRPAPDVTAVARQALAACGVGLAADPERQDRAVLPRAYWWASPLYVLAMRARARGARALTAEQRRAVLGFRPQGAFEQALLLTLRARHGLPVRDLAEALAQAQSPCGLWPGSARLRLVLAETPEPWREIGSGALYADEKGLFTSATALAALAIAQT